MNRATKFFFFFLFYHVPGTVLGTSNELTHFIPRATSNKYYYYLYLKKNHKIAEDSRWLSH